MGRNAVRSTEEDSSDLSMWHRKESYLRVAVLWRQANRKRCNLGSVTSKDVFRYSPPTVLLILKWVKGPGSNKSRSLSKERKASELMWCPVLSSDAFQALLAISALLTSRFRETFWAIHRIIFFHGGKLAWWLGTSLLSQSLKVNHVDS